MNAKMVQSIFGRLLYNGTQQFFRNQHLCFKLYRKSNWSFKLVEPGSRKCAILRWSLQTDIQNFESRGLILLHVKKKIAI